MDKFNFDQIIKKLEQAKSSLPKVLANDTKKFFLSSWQKQGWDDGVVKSWAPRKYNKNKRANRKNKRKCKNKQCSTRLSS